MRNWANNKYLVYGLLFGIQLSCSSIRTNANQSRSPILPAAIGGIPAGWKLVWSEEFSVDGSPDLKTWSFDTFRNSQGWFNDELQYYSSNRLENAKILNGSLMITARKEELKSEADWGGQAYTSARLITRGKAEWTYGFFEIRAKLPCGSGTWPAIWLLGSGGQWPADGELDIMEHSGPNENVILGTVHNSSYFGGGANGGQIKINDVCGEFHRYQMLWNEQKIVFGVDDINYFQYENRHAGREEWPYDQPFYLILNVAIGGTLGGPVKDSIFPVSMTVDYIRVYQNTK